MFVILEAYGIPPAICNAIKVVYLETSAIVLTPEGETAPFSINTGVLQGDPLAPFLFIVVLDYALRQSISHLGGILLKRRRRARHPAQHLADLDYADHIALMENLLKSAESLPPPQSS